MTSQTVTYNFYHSSTFLTGTVAKRTSSFPYSYRPQVGFILCFIVYDCRSFFFQNVLRSVCWSPFQLEPIVLSAPITPRHLLGELWFTFALSLHSFELSLKNRCLACLKNSSIKNCHQHTAVFFCTMWPRISAHSAHICSVWSRLRGCGDFDQDFNLSHKVVMSWLTQTVVMWLRLIMGFYGALCVCSAFPKKHPHSGILGLSLHLATIIDSKIFFKSDVYTCSQ
jgi:hypothetical protein